VAIEIVRDSASTSALDEYTIVHLLGYFAFIVICIFVMYPFVKLDSLELSFYICCFVALSRTIVLLLLFHPHRVYVSSCTLCLLGVDIMQFLAVPLDLHSVGPGESHQLKKYMVKGM
jgi:hypothetical protein